ncbi:hypothetical protein BC829DRAFT_92127 [Chytridium lagenaria]|nr:hypothetical protein BC829DRAFT_92127 [Chytridium lagenaria]
MEGKDISDIARNWFHGTFPTKVTSSLALGAVDQNCVEFEPDVNSTFPEALRGFGKQNPRETCIANIEREKLAGRWQEFDPIPPPTDSASTSSIDDIPSATASTSMPITTIPTLISITTTTPIIINFVQAAEDVVLPETRANIVAVASGSIMPTTPQQTTTKDLDQPPRFTAVATTPIDGSLPSISNGVSFPILAAVTISIASFLLVCFAIFIAFRMARRTWKPTVDANENGAFAMVSTRSARLPGKVTTGHLEFSQSNNPIPPASTSVSSNEKQVVFTVVPVATSERTMRDGKAGQAFGDGQSNRDRGHVEMAPSNLGERLDAHSWTVQDVTEWMVSIGFNEDICDRFKGVFPPPGNI